MPAPKNTICFNKQPSYTELQAEHVAAGTLFEDTSFPANQTSIGMDLGEEIKWMRPHEIVKGFEGDLQAEFVVDEASRMDINQGRLGDCWLMAGIAALCETMKLFDKVVDPDQGFSEEKKYCGLFRFRFWRFGEWVEVCVDDFLPTINGKLVFLQSQGKSQNEFWPALFEKAYAKVHGSYGCLSGGQPIVAMRDFTGGVLETYDLKKLQEGVNLHDILRAAFKKHALIGASVNAIPGRPGESDLACGLIAGHAYTVTDAKVINGTPLVRVRNPHGARGVEWNGAWSDDCRFQMLGKEEETPDGWSNVTTALVKENLQTVFKTVKENAESELVALDEGCCMVTSEPEAAGFTSWTYWQLGADKFCSGENSGDDATKKIVFKRGSEEWNALDDQQKKDLGLQLEQDGEFWMSFDDFVRYFDDVSVCNLTADSLEDDSDDDIGWKLQQFHGKWTKGVNAGGCTNYRETFHTNPQVYVVLRDIDTDDDDLSSCLVALMHKEKEQGRKNIFQTYSRGVAIFPCKGDDEELLKSGKPLPMERFNRNPTAVVNYTNARECSKRFTLPPGPYVFVPSSFEPDKEGEFLLRIFSETELKDSDDVLDPEEELEAKIVQSGL